MLADSSQGMTLLVGQSNFSDLFAFESGQLFYLSGTSGTVRGIIYQMRLFCSSNNLGES